VVQCVVVRSRSVEFGTGRGRFCACYLTGSVLAREEQTQIRSLAASKNTEQQHGGFDTVAFFLLAIRSCLGVPRHALNGDVEVAVRIICLPVASTITKTGNVHADRPENAQYTDQPSEYSSSSARFQSILSTWARPWGRLHCPEHSIAQFLRGL
jgi:hypothetical protein